MNKQELQSLLGKVLYILHLLGISRNNHSNLVIWPDEGLSWNLKFLFYFNVVISFEFQPVLHTVYLDATLKGIGCSRESVCMQLISQSG